MSINECNTQNLFKLFIYSVSGLDRCQFDLLQYETCCDALINRGALSRMTRSTLVTECSTYVLSGM